MVLNNICPHALKINLSLILSVQIIHNLTILEWRISEMTKFNFKLIDNFDIVSFGNDNHRDNFCESQFFIMQELKHHRETIDSIDRKIAELLGQRFRIAEQVADIKRLHHIPVRIEKRITEVLDNAKRHEIEFKLPPQLGYFLWREIIEATCYHEEHILGIDHEEEQEN